MGIETEAAAKVSESGPSFSRATALERVGGDEELLLEIAELFLGEYPSLATEIGAAVQAGDGSRLLSAAHTLKGSLGTLGAEPAYQLALRLEMMGRNRQLDGASDAFQSLQALLDVLHKDLQGMIG